MLENAIHLLVFILVNGCVIFSSWRLAGILLAGNRAITMHIIAAGILAFAHATIVVLFLGVVIRSLGVWSVPIASLILSSLVLMLSRKAAQPLYFIRGIKWAWHETVREQRDYVLYILMALFVAQAAFMLLEVIWLPPHVWDVFVYHLPPAVEWYQQGYIPPVIDTTINRINGAPLGITVLAYWCFIFFRDDMLVELPMFLWALLLVPVSVAVMRQSGVSRAWALKFAIVIFFIPSVIMQGVTVKDHLALNISFIAGMLFVAEFIKTRQYQILLLAAAAFGLMLGYKIPAPLYLVVVLAVFVVLLWRRQRELFIDTAQRLELLKTTGIAAVFAFLISGYWYVKNLLVYGRLQGAYGIEQSDTGEQILRSSGALDAVTTQLVHSGKIVNNLVEFFPRIFDYQGTYTTNLIGVSGFGPQFAAFGLLAILAGIVAFFRKDMRQQPIFLLSSTVLLLFTVMLFLNYNSNSYRILSFFPMVLIAYAAVQLYLYKILDHGISRLCANVLLLISVLWSGLLLLPPQDTNQLRLKEFISLDAKDRTAANYTRWFTIHRPNFYHLLSEIPTDEPIAHVAYRGSLFTESSADTWQYTYVDRHWRRKVYSLNLPDYFNCNGTVCGVRPALKTFLAEKKISLLSSCKVNHCLTIRDKSFFELMPGLYYFRGLS